MAHPTNPKRLDILLVWLKRDQPWKQKNHAFTLVNGPGSSSNGCTMKISNDTHFGDSWDPDFGDRWCITGCMDYLRGRVILQNKEVQIEAVVL
jgi:hypothetical protein